MTQDLSESDFTSAQHAYLEYIKRLSERTTMATRTRLVTIHVSWIIVLLAGAGVALAEAVVVTDTAWTWVPATLGFVVVVFQGIDRVFGRTSEGSRAEDTLRRELAHEQRCWRVGAADYRNVDSPFDVLVERCEDVIKKYDDTMTAYYAELAGGSGK